MYEIFLQYAPIANIHQLMTINLLISFNKKYSNFLSPVNVISFFLKFIIFFSVNIYKNKVGFYIHIQIKLIIFNFSKYFFISAYKNWKYYGMEVPFFNFKIMNCKLKPWITASIQALKQFETSNLSLREIKRFIELNFMKILCWNPR